MSRPTAGEYNIYYDAFINLVPEGMLVDLLRKTQDDTQQWLNGVDNAKGDFAYAEGKWTIKEVIMHLIDTEQIFLTRALRIARNDQTPNPGFDQNNYVDAIDLSDRSLLSLQKEFQAMRHLTIARFEQFQKTDLLKTGIASNSTISVRALGYIIMGHEIHHRNVLQERYFD
ncbi:MAG: DinB family protein [Bacteroidota bacterium]